MTGSRGERRAALLAPAVALGLLVLVWAASTGPVQVLAPSGRTRTFDTPPPPTAEATASPGTGTLKEITAGVEQRLDLSWLGTLIAWAVLILIVLGVAVAVRAAVRHRWRRAAPPPRVDFEVLPEERAAASLAEDAQARLAAVEEGTPRNGIVRCWARLEDSVAEAGMPRGRAETSAEFTVRVLHGLDLDPRAIGELARLYREARFSEHPLGEEARSTARAALVRLQDDLAAVRGAR